MKRLKNLLAKRKLVKGQVVNNFEVFKVYPCSYVQCDGAYTFGDDDISLNVSRMIVIEIV